MAFTLNRRLAQLIDSNGQLNTGKIPNDYITSDHVANNTITSAMLHTSFTVSTSNLTSIDTDDVSEGSSNLYFTNARADARIASADTDDLSEGSTNLYFTNARVDSRLSGGTGVTYSSGEISIGQDVGTTATPTFGNITTTGYLAGPATFTIDPAAVGDNTGTVVIAGNLQVDGTTTTINSTTMTVDDLNLTLASGAANAAAANGAGITVDGASATITYDGTNDVFEINKGISITGATLVSDDQSNDWVKQSVSGTTSTLTFGNTESTSGQAKWEYTRSDGRFKGYIGANSVNNFMSIISTGEIGIGTDNPNADLHISSAGGTELHLQEENAGAAAQVRFTTTQNSFEIGADANPQIFFINTTGNQGSGLCMDTSHNVGIGTDNPYTLLELSSTDPIIRMTDSNGVADKSIYEMRAIGASGYESLEFRSVNDANSVYNKLLVLKHGGNIGIGTDSPDYQVHIKKTGIAEMQLEGTVAAEFNLQDSGGTANQRRGRLTQNGSGLKLQAVNDADDTVTYEFITMDCSTGHVGIGTTNPDNALMVQGASTAGDSSTGNLALFEGPSGTNGLKIFVDDTANAAGLQTIGGDYLLLNPHGGNVGIGIDDPQTKLQIVGSTNSATSTGGTLGIRQKGDGSNDGITITSSHANSGRIYKDASGNLHMYNTGGDANDFVLSNGGKVGIGTDNPVRKLTVNSGTANATAHFESTDSTQYISLKDSAGQVAIGNTGAEMRFWTGDAVTETMRIDADGKVGIGTNDPSEMLSIETDSSSPAVLVKANGQGGNTSITCSLILSNGSLSSNDSAPAVYSYRTSDYSVTALRSSGLKFQTTNSNAPVTAMTINNTGKVGIGTDNPSRELHVYKASGNVTAQIQSGSSGVAALKLQTSAGTSTVYTGVGSIQGFQFYANGTSEAMRIVGATGNVGIGTDNPAEKLHIRDSSTNADVYIKIANDSRDWFMGVEGSNSDILSFKTHDASNLLNITSSGNVGIGTNNPQQKLQVDGNIYLGPNDTTNYVHSGGNLILTADTTVSIVADANDTAGPASGGTILFGAGSNTNTDSNADFTDAEFGGGVPRVEYGRFDATGFFGIGNNAPAVSLDVGTQTDAIRVPNGTTAQRPTVSAGAIRFNTTLGKLEQYNGTVWRILTTVYTIDYLILGGGGSGGDCTSPARFGGGGGAGGLRTSYGTVSGRASSAENPLEVQPENTLTITVGAGAAGGVSSHDTAGTQGNNSSISGGNFTTVTSLGGGGGGGNSVVGTDGGCGGGGQESTGAGRSGTAGQGFDGGTGSESADRGGGGGGTGANGTGTDGGAGTSVSITGSAVTYGGGGASSGSGGSGGGGTGSTNGTANLGGGGGAAGSQTGAGGSGVVILRMATADYSGITTGSPTVTTSGSDTIVKFTSSGTYTT